VHFLQIWLQPNRLGVQPSYEQRHYPLDERQGRLVLLVSPDGRDDSISSNQDALLYGGLLAANDRQIHRLPTDGRAYVHVARGSVAVNDTLLNAGDGISIAGVPEVRFDGLDQAEVLLFDLP
jgi:redox-sensitive bicupin YhaK (pirin superfamily)